MSGGETDLPLDGKSYRVISQRALIQGKEELWPLVEYAVDRIAVI